MRINKLQGADGIRAIACLIVIAHHIPTVLSIPNFGVLSFFIRLTESGDAGVSVFFVLSGFLLSYPFWEAYLTQTKMPNLREYVVRRATRIMPGFYLNLFFCYLITILMLPYLKPSIKLAYSALFWRYLSGLTFTSGFHWITLFPSPINSPLWSISFEVISYILMPLSMLGLFIFFKEKPSLLKGLLWWGFVLSLICIINQLIIENFKINQLDRGLGGQYSLAKLWMPNYNPIGFFCHFSMGILASAIVARLNQTRWTVTIKKIGVWDIAGFIFICLIGWLFFFNESNIAVKSFQNQPYKFPIFAILIAFLLLSLTQSRYLGRAFDNPLFSYISKISFGLYIWHYLVLVVVKGILFNYVYHTSLKTLNGFLFGSLLALIISFLIASASWFLIEKPILKKGHAWTPKMSIKSIIFSKEIVITAFVLILIPFLLALYRPYVFSFPPQ